MKLSIVIPVYNEVNTITQLINNVKSVEICHDKEIIVVDDGCTDGTSEILNAIKDKNIKVYRHEKNQGKGIALRTAFSHVNGDIVIIQDADLEYDPRDYDSLIDPIIRHGADVVYGSRLSGGKSTRVYMFWHKDWK